MNIACDYKDCPAAATHVVFIKTGCLTLCDHHTRSLRHALNRKGCFIAPIAALSHFRAGQRVMGTAVSFTV